MRILQFGAELPLDVDGWTDESGMMSGYYRDTMTRRQASSGVGGAASLYGWGPGVARRAFGRQLVEVWARYCVMLGSLGTPFVNLRFLQGATDVAELRVNASAQVELYVDGVLVDTATEVLAASTWYVLTTRFRMTASGGLFECFLDHDLVNPIASFTGDCDPSLLGYLDGLELRIDSGWADDLAVHTPTLSFEAASGGSPVGLTITGASSGAQAVVTAVEGVSAGRVFLRSLAGTFVADEAVSGGGWSATLVGGLEANSGAPSSHGYVVVLAPSGEGAFTDCSPSMVGDNWANVDDWGSAGSTDDASFVESVTDGARDRYTVSVPTGFTGINAVEVVARAQRQGDVINGIELLLHADSVEHAGAFEALSTTWATHRTLMDVRPDTGEAWAPGDLADLEVGFRFGA